MSKTIHRILLANGIDPTNSEILRIEQIGANSIIYVLFEGIEYRLDGFNKSIVGELKKVVEKPKRIKTTIMYKPKVKNVVEEVVEEVEVEVVEEVKKPRGWHFRPVYVDSLGNVYHKGVLQPDLKGTLEPSL